MPTSSLYDITEATRVLTYDLVSQTALSLARIHKPKWFRNSDGVDAFIVEEAVKFRRRKPAAKFSVHDGSVLLTIQAQGRGDRDIPFMMGGDISNICPTADRDIEVARIVDEWLVTLGQPLNSHYYADGEALRRKLFVLGTGLLTAASIQCDQFTMRARRHGQHSINISSHSDFKKSAQSLPEEVGPALMTPELISEMDKLACKKIHIFQDIFPHPGEMPVISVGSPPEVNCVNSADVVARLSAVAKLPANARLNL